MYFRFATLADLAANVLNLSSQNELANRLGIAHSTLNAYRNGTRFPTEGRSSVRRALSELLAEAFQAVDLQAFDADRYVLSSLHAEERLLRLYRRFPEAFCNDFGKVATQIALHCLEGGSLTEVSHGINEQELARSVLKVLVMPATPEAKGLAAYWILKRSKIVLEEKFGLERSFRSSMDFSRKQLEEIVEILQNGYSGAETFVNELSAIDIILACADAWVLREERADPPNLGEGPAIRLCFIAQVGGIDFRTEGCIVSWHARL